MKLFVDREKDLDLDLISFVEKKKTKKKKNRKSMRAAMAMSVAGRFFGHAYFRLSRDGEGGFFEVEGGAGAIDG